MKNKPRCLIPHRSLLLPLVCLLLALPLRAAEVDSTRFVRTSLVVAEPGTAIYSVFGHAALHMECPSVGLDYAFTFETEPNVLKFFLGQAKACFVAVPTKEYLSIYVKEGRGAKAYEVNLTPAEKRELWRVLDEDMVQGPHRQFNFVQHNCLSMSMTMIESVMMNEQFKFGFQDYYNQFTNAEGIRYYARRVPWAQFIFMTFIGSEADGHWAFEQRLAPEYLPRVLMASRIVNTETGKSRPALIGKPKTILLNTVVLKPTPLTPTLLFGILLVLLLALSVAERLMKDNAGLAKTMRVVDITLFTLQTLAGFILLYVTLVTNLFGLHWNWYLIPFNPLPFVAWLIWRKRPKMFWKKVYGFYTLILVLFLIVTPWITSQMDLAHGLLVAILAVRCFSK